MGYFFFWLFVGVFLPASSSTMSVILMNMLCKAGMLFAVHLVSNTTIWTKHTGKYEERYHSLANVWLYA